MADMGSLWKGAAGLVFVALRAFLGTLLIVLLIGVLLSGVAAYLLRDSLLLAVIAVLLALIESLIAAIFLGGKRALVMALVHGVRSLHLGRSAVRLVFERLLKVSSREGLLARTAERLPLAQAESRLTATIDDLLGKPEASGWFRKWMQARLLIWLRKCTLARFREEGAQHGGVDLVKMQAELETTIDDVLAHKFKSGLNLVTVLVLLGLPVLVLGQTYLLSALFPPSG
jgi:hypothetical protein